MSTQCCEHCKHSGEDHDLLIEINTRLERFTLDLQARDKLHDDHENRLRRLERWGFLAIGALVVLELGIGVVSKLL